MKRYELTIPEGHSRTNGTILRMVIRARNEGEARLRASKQCGAEGPRVWLAAAPCKELPDVTLE